MEVQVYINDKNAYSTWGVFFENGGVNALLTPPPMKEYVQNKSSAEHGKTVYVSSPKTDERDIQIPMCIVASSQSQFIDRYSSFISEMQKGAIKMRVVYGVHDVTYNLLYLSCQQFNQAGLRLGKFILRLNEPNPNNRIVQ